MRTMVAFIALLSSCAGHRLASPKPPQWCFQPSAPASSGWRLLADAAVAPVSRDSLSQTTALLRNRSVVEISRSAAARYVGYELEDGQRFFLARAGIHADPDIGQAQALEIARTLSFHVEWTPELKAVLIMTWHITAPPIAPHNVPVILTASVDVEHVYVSCYAEGVVPAQR